MLHRYKKRFEAGKEILLLSMCVRVVRGLDKQARVIGKKSILERIELVEIYLEPSLEPILVVEERIGNGNTKNFVVFEGILGF